MNLRKLRVRSSEEYESPSARSKPNEHTASHASEDWSKRSSIAFSWNSALAFASAYLITSAIHETGHGLMAKALSASPTISAFAEQNTNVSAHHEVLILLCGPLTTLAIGLLFLAVFKAQRAHYSFSRLLFFWLAWTAIMNFVNYLIVTPWLKAGDTAQIVSLTRAPAYTSYAIASVGILLLIGLARTSANSMLAVAPEELRLTARPERARYFRRGFLYPVAAGTALLTPLLLASQPDNTRLGLLGAIGIVDIVSVGIRAVGARREPAGPEQDDPIRISGPGIMLLIALVALYAFILSPGLHF